MFDLKKSKIYKGIQTKIIFGFFSFLRILALIVFVPSFLFFIFALILDLYEPEVLSLFLGIVILSLSSLLLFQNFVWFFKHCLREARKIERIESEDINLADFLTIESTNIILKAIKFSKKKNIELNSSLLLYYIIRHKNHKIDVILARCLIDPRDLMERLEDAMWKTKDVYEGTGEVLELKEFVLEAAKACVRRKGEHIQTMDFVSALSKIEPVLKEELRKRRLEKEDIDDIDFWQETLNRRVRENKLFWKKDNLLKHGSIARDWASGYTPTLDKFSSDITELMKKIGFEEIIGHTEEIEQAERILSRPTQNNVLIVGEPGVGRNSIVRALALKSFMGRGMEEIKDRRFVELDIFKLITNIQTIEEIEAVLDQCFREAALAGNVILILNDFDSYLSEKARMGTIDISGLIVPYLNSPEFKFIAITSFKGLHKYIEQKPGVLSLFERVEAKESSEKDTLRLLLRQVLILEHKYNKFISYSAIKKIMELCSKYISDGPFPRKAINLINDVFVYAYSQEKDFVIMPEHVEKVVSSKTEIPIGNIELKEKESLLNMEDLLHKRVINQSIAIKEIASALRRARTDIRTKKGPMGSFLFLGPTGVGKTETAKALAETYFGSESKMIRMDMSEFQQIQDIDRFIGSEDEPGILASSVKESPFSLILLDEIEKAHPNILNLFLQVLDEGVFTDSWGRKIDFSNTILIATSNAGYKLILEAVKQDKALPELKQEILDYVFKEGVFRPEFINRFDGVVVFKTLSRNNLLDIAALRFNKLISRLKEKQIEMVVTEELKERIVDLSYNPAFGAREMRRVIQDSVENELAKGLLSGDILEGDKIKVDPKDFKIIILERRTP